MPETERPFLEMPDEQEIQADDLLCWLNPDRICGADCQAYTTLPAESNILNEQQKHCVLLVALERLGRYSGAIARLLKEAKGDLDRAMQSLPRGG